MLKTIDASHVRLEFLITLEPQDIVAHAFRYFETGRRFVGGLMRRSASPRMQLAPYLYFYGRCEEALEFYKKALGGEYEVSRFEGSPMAEHVPPGFANKIMHARFKGDGFEFMASDGQPDKKIDPEEGNIALSLSMQIKRRPIAFSRRSPTAGPSACRSRMHFGAAVLEW